MKHTLMLFATFLTLAVAGCATRAPKVQEKPTGPISSDRPGEKLDAALPKELLSRRIVQILMKEVYGRTPAEPNPTVDPETGAMIVRVWVIDPKLQAAADSIADLVIASGGQEITEVTLGNSTNRPLLIRVGTSFLPIEVPLAPGERRSWRGPGSQYLQDIEVEIVEQKR